MGHFYLLEHEIESLARVFLPDILAFFESDEGKAEYAAHCAEMDSYLFSLIMSIAYTEQEGDYYGK